MHEKPLMKDWADMRMFLAIVEQGSLMAAAEQLELTQPTVGRRLAAMEERLGLPLFVRTGRRMQLTDTGNLILENARRMEREMLAIERAVEVQSKGLAGEVVITSTEGTGTEWLAPELKEFHKRHPDIVLNIRVDSRSVDLVRREADIALRLGRPTEPDLIARFLVNIGFGLYASESYLRKHGELKSLEEIADRNIIAIYGPSGISRLTFNLDSEERPMGKTVFATNSPAAQISAARAGYGIAALSHRWAAMYKELRPVLPGFTVAETEMWLVTHEELRHSARIRAVSDFLAERIVLNKKHFQGP